LGTGDKVASLFPGLESLMATALACALCFVTITEYSWSMFKEASEVGQCTFVRFFLLLLLLAAFFAVVVLFHLSLSQPSDWL